jgi:uncharacterized protein (TIGR02118 family)
MALYAPAPIKRMSILEKRTSDTRDYFSHHWRTIHGGMVSRLPYLAAYNQNHVVEKFATGLEDYPADGFVEQLWRSTAQMQAGYNSPVVAELIGDEPNYLGHGSNYAILTSVPLRADESGAKLIASLRHGGDVAWIEKITAQAAGLDKLSQIIRDDVIATIAKPNMLPVPPRPADAFLHLHFVDVAAAQTAAGALVRFAATLATPARAAFGLHRVVTATIVG